MTGGLSAVESSAEDIDFWDPTSLPTVEDGGGSSADESSAEATNRDLNMVPPALVDGPDASVTEAAELAQEQAAAALAEAEAHAAELRAAEPAQLRSLDCSGYMRMVWGYRSGLPLTLMPNGTAIPRRAFEMLNSAPGVVTIANAGTQAIAFSRLSTGDLVFFDAATDDGTQIDHVGMYLGVDSGGHHRFVSSRKTANGPTLGDLGGKSLLDGTGHYAVSFRAARRL